MASQTSAILPSNMSPSVITPRKLFALPQSAVIERTPTRQPVVLHSMDAYTVCPSLNNAGENIATPYGHPIQTSLTEKNKDSPSKRSLAQRARRERERNEVVVSQSPSIFPSNMCHSTITPTRFFSHLQSPIDEPAPSIPTAIQPSMETFIACSLLSVGESIMSTNTAVTNSSSNYKNQHGPSKRCLAQQARREREKNVSVNTRALIPTTLWPPFPPQENHATMPVPPHSLHTDNASSSLSVEVNIDSRDCASMSTSQRNIPSSSTLLNACPSPSSITESSRMAPTLEDSMYGYQYDDSSDDGESIEMDTIVPPAAHFPLGMQVEGRHYLGKMDIPCRFCGALHWIDERLKKSSIANPRFGSCCLQGQIKLPLLSALPPPFQALYDGNDRRSKSFRKHMREYNSANAFKSLGVQMDDRVLGGRGPRPFTIHGELRHRTGSLLPDQGQRPSYSQLYIYDPSSVLEIRQQRNPRLDGEVLRIIQEALLHYNKFSKDFLHAHEILTDASVGNEETFNIPAYLHYSSKKDKRRYNLPTADEVAIILPGDGGEVDCSRDIVLHLKGGNGLMQISECHPAYLPLHYVLMFPHGDLGWTPELRRWNISTETSTRARLTQMNFYSYLLFQRHTEYSPILRGKKLFQEFLVDGWAVTEQNRLRYYRQKQSKIRAELYQGLNDFSDEGVGLHQVGRRVVLPSSYTGSPRHMFEIFQDSMAITRYHHHPDVFVTMTANPAWPEILEALLPFQDVTDRPDLVARVFELKRAALMDEIKKNGVFGNAVAHVYTIEFQKRGLPHMHALIYLQHLDKICVPAQVDQIVSAEFPDPNTDPVLFQTVLKCMVHGPCGTRDPHASCMENNICTKRYPRKWSDVTMMDKDGYPIYRRPCTGKTYIVKGQMVDNRDVVPYNPYLSRMFNCHINVEVCAGLQCVKYIHKYIFKGGDRATMVLTGQDEIQQYLDARYIGPPEAAWRLFGNRLHEEKPKVQRLDLHLPGMHRVLFDPDESIEAILEKARTQKSTLTAFFDCCAADAYARELTYQEFPQHYVWNKHGHKWTRRKHGFAIGRLYFASPNSGERFYLRLLLTIVKGPRTFDDLKTYENHLFHTFKEACVARGLLEDDQEYIHCLEEAAVMKTGYALRRLFSLILLQCHPINPHQLWTRFYTSICDDLAYKIRTKYHIASPSDEQVNDYGLFLINEILFESGRSLADFPPMPLPTEAWNLVVQNRLLWEQRQFQYDEQNERAHENAVHLNVEQRHAYDIVVESVSQNEGKLFFLNGPAGTGKTFVYNTIAATCRRRGDIVIMVASSGIASLLLAGGRTAHSMFKIPLDVVDNSICGFSKQSQHAELFREAKLIIWDEVPMQHRFCVEAVDQTLQDIRDSSKPFGGITVVLGGDFRQCLPVVPKGVREQIVGASLKRSTLWMGVEVLTLVQNMRLMSNDPENIQFANFLTEVGTIPNDIVQLPSSVNTCKNMQELISATYPGIERCSTVTAEYLTKRTILAARNDDVYEINMAALDVFPGQMFTSLAADKMADEDANNPANVNRYPNEYLNSLNPPGLPPFSLNLKVGSPIMLLRNLAPKDGLCNGTRLMVTRCAPHCIQAKILTGDKAGEDVFIPRISLTPSSSDFPFQMTRRQFPVRLAYAMTINKSQGQSVKYVGIDIRTEVFSHGQLYVALSRCTSAKRINVLLPPNSDKSTTNIVYPEVLL